MSDKFEDFLQFTDDREAVSVAREFDLVCHAALLANCLYLGFAHLRRPECRLRT